MICCTCGLCVSVGFLTVFWIFFFHTLYIFVIVAFCWILFSSTFCPCYSFENNLFTFFIYYKLNKVFYIINPHKKYCNYSCICMTHYALYCLWWPSQIWLLHVLHDLCGLKLCNTMDSFGPHEASDAPCDSLMNAWGVRLCYCTQLNLILTVLRFRPPGTFMSLFYLNSINPLFDIKKKYLCLVCLYKYLLKR